MKTLVQPSNRSTHQTPSSLPPLLRRSKGRKQCEIMSLLSEGLWPLCSRKACLKPNFFFPEAGQEGARRQTRCVLPPSDRSSTEAAIKLSLAFSMLSYADPDQLHSTFYPTKTTHTCPLHIHSSSTWLCVGIQVSGKVVWFIRGKETLENRGIRI